MKAIQVNQHQELHWQRVKSPSAEAHEVLITVHAAGVNRADLLQVRGLYPPPEGASPILGLEVAGYIKAVGSEVKGWQKGDAVMALLPGGGYAEEVAVAADVLLPLPADWDFTEGAAVPEALFTTYFNLIKLGQLRAGENVLIHSGAGGIGSTAIQIGKLFGANVFATTGSKEKVQYCRDLGADYVFDHQTDDLRESIFNTAPEGIQLVIDTIGDNAYAKLHTDVLSFKGRWLLIGLLGGVKAEINMAKMLSKNIMLKGSTLRNQPLSVKRSLAESINDEVLTAYQSRQVMPCVDSIFPVSEAASAHSYLTQNHVKGKVILQLNTNH